MLCLMQLDEVLAFCLNAFSYFLMSGWLYMLSVL